MKQMIENLVYLCKKQGKQPFYIEVPADLFRELANELFLVGPIYIFDCEIVPSPSGELVVNFK